MNGTLLQRIFQTAKKKKPLIQLILNIRQMFDQNSTTHTLGTDQNENICGLRKGTLCIDRPRPNRFYFFNNSLILDRRSYGTRIVGKYTEHYLNFE